MTTNSTWASPEQAEKLQKMHMAEHERRMALFDLQENLLKRGIFQLLKKVIVVIIEKVTKANVLHSRVYSCLHKH